MSLAQCTACLVERVRVTLTAQADRGRQAETASGDEGVVVGHDGRHATAQGGCEVGWNDGRGIRE